MTDEIRIETRQDRWLQAHALKRKNLPLRQGAIGLIPELCELMAGETGTLSHGEAVSRAIEAAVSRLRRLEPGLRDSDIADQLGPRAEDEMVGAEVVLSGEVGAMLVGIAARWQRRPDELIADILYRLDVHPDDAHGDPLLIAGHAAREAQVGARALNRRKGWEGDDAIDGGRWVEMLIEHARKSQQRNDGSRCR